MQTLSKTLIKKTLQWIKGVEKELSRDELLAMKATLETDNDRLKGDLESSRDDNKRMSEVIGHLENDLGVTIAMLDRDVPSILEQTPYPTGFYSFGKARPEGVRFFNQAILEREGKDFLICRRATPNTSLASGFNDIVAFELNNNNPVYMHPVQFKSTYKDQHFEDPRAVTIAGRVMISVTSFTTKGNSVTSYPHQLIGAVASDGWRINPCYDPIYGTNGGSCATCTGHEKNWLWFEHDGVPMFVYSNYPHVVVEMPDYMTTSRIHKTEVKNPYWMHGEIRGGTPPVRIGDEYLSFFHSSLPWIGHKRRYHMGAYCFEAKPPFKITRSSLLPILSGSRNDPWVQGLPLVVFPCGSLLRNGEWLVTLGVNDCESAWIKIPHERLMETMKKIE